MAMPMKSWYVTVLRNNFTQVECIKCISAQQATERLKEMKEKYVNQPATENSPAVTYTFFRDQF
jgi:hypothetical protein